MSETKELVERLERERDAAATLKAENERLKKDNREARRLIASTHKRAVKHENCERLHCPICDGGLFQCADCGAAEIETEERICTAALREGREQQAVAEASRLRERVATLEELIRWAHDTLYEINLSNYDHDEVCRLNDASVEVILRLAPALEARDEARRALATQEQAHVAGEAKPESVNEEGEE